MRFMSGSFSNGDQRTFSCRSLISGKIFSGGAEIFVERSMRKRSGCAAAMSRIATITTATTAAAIASVVNMGAPDCCSARLRGVLRIVDHPWRAEAIDHHAEAYRPERFLKRHVDLSALFERLEDPLGVLRALHTDVNPESLRLLRMFRRSVRRHQLRGADGHAGVNDLLFPVGGNASFGGRPFMRQHRVDLAAEQLGVEVERFLAIAVEEEIGIARDRHGTLRI